MIFAMYWVTETAKRVIVPQRLFDFQHDVTRGEFEVRGPGTLFLRWANTHTWFGEKVLSYEVDILEVNDGAMWKYEECVRWAITTPAASFFVARWSTLCCPILNRGALTIVRRLCET